jgi:hypothetical protein
MEIDRSRLLEVEMGLLQATLDKYDGLIWRNRGWLMVVWAGTLAVGVKEEVPALVAGAPILAGVFWFTEGILRTYYQRKYVWRYRRIRDAFNAVPPETGRLSLYDLTDHYGPKRPGAWERARDGFVRWEPAVFYGVFLVLGLAAYLLLTRDWQAGCC